MFVELGFLGASQIPSTLIWETHELQSLPEMGLASSGHRPSEDLEGGAVWLRIPLPKELGGNSKVNFVLPEQMGLVGSAREPSAGKNEYSVVFVLGFAVFQSTVPKQRLLKPRSHQHG